MHNHIGIRNPFFGKHHTKETKEKLRLFRLGKSPATKGRGIIKEKQYCTLPDGCIALKINLSKGKYAIIDEDDFERVNKIRWFSHPGGYASGKTYSNGNTRTIYLHRFILNAPKEAEVDHKNLDKLDNRKVNLRLCTPTQNLINMNIKKDNTSGYKGVYLDKRIYLKKRWHATIKKNKKPFHIGYFETREQAALAYNENAKSLYGNFARLNTII